ncbi:MAG TPA: NUDIX domain-containing protein [Chloroflexi bacterium]|nr:NUDIX domain-containing protein [Chloroflexota bacterium]
MNPVPGSPRIRPLALGLIWRGDELLVFEGHNHVKGETFYRPLGGGILFGEQGPEALRREFHEELGALLTDVIYLATLENIFTCNGRPGHEIVLLYEANLADPSFYESEQFEVHEEEETLTARWIPLNELCSGDLFLYPDGLPQLLMDRYAK